MTATVDLVGPGSSDNESDAAELERLVEEHGALRQELSASRARIIEAGDAERRRLERNLHDGTQQRLVSLALTLKLADSQVDRSPAAAHDSLARAADELGQALRELRELARGLHPGALRERGLRPALEGLTDRAGFTVQIAELPSGRMPEAVEVTAYYVVSEALANAGKHAPGSQATIQVRQVNGCAIVEVSDDGPGGADPTGGSGLCGLADRVEAIGGELQVHSPRGEGTRVRVTLPIERRSRSGRTPI